MSGRSDEEIREEFWEKIAWEESEDGLDRDSWRLGLLIDVLAWVCRQTRKGIADIDLDGWPDGLSVWQDAHLTILALKDPLIFQCARLQMSDLFANAASNSIELDCIPKEAWEFSEKFLQTGIPPKRGRFGDHLARDILVWQIFRGAEEVGKWCGNCLKRTASKCEKSGFSVNYEALDFKYFAAGFATCLADELNGHRTLMECADCVPSPELIRSVLKKGNGDFGWIKPGELLSDLEWPED